MLSEKHEDIVMDWDVGERFAISSDSASLEITHELRVAHSVKRIAKLVRAIARTSSPLFVIERRGGRHILRPLGRGSELIRALGSGLNEIEELLAGNEFNAYLQLLRDARDEFPKYELCLPRADAVPSHLAYVAADEMNALVAWLRIQAKSEAFRKDLDNQRRKCDDNTRSATKFFDAWIARHSRLLAIRLDLVPRAADAREARRMLKSFMRHVRETFGYFLGSIVKFETGALTGLHFHVVLLLNGHEHQSGVQIGKMLGEHWNGVLTEGRGRYFNCNTRTHSYRENALGMIERIDGLKRKAFVKWVIGYLAKTDFWIRIAGVRKTFTRSPMP